MKRLLLISALLSTVLISCQKDPDTITVISKQGGDVTLKVLDESGTPFKGAIVSLANSYSGGGILYYDSTKADGNCAIGKLLEGNYRYQVSAKRGKITYGETGYFQVIGGEAKTIESNPFANVTKVGFRIMDYFNDEPIENVNVALIPYQIYSGSGLTFQEMIEDAYFIGSTDGEGWVRFSNVPYLASTGTYSIIIYYNENNYTFPVYNNYFNLSHDSPNNFTVEVTF